MYVVHKYYTMPHRRHYGTPQCSSTAIATYSNMCIICNNLSHHQVQDCDDVAIVLVNHVVSIYFFLFLLILMLVLEIGDWRRWAK